MEPNDALEALARRISDLEAFAATQGYRPKIAIEGPPPIAEHASPPPIPLAEVAMNAEPPIEVAEPPMTAMPFERPHAMPPPLPPHRAVAAKVAAMDAMTSSQASVPPPPASVASIPYAVPLPPRLPVAPSNSVEQAIGLKLAGWIGAIVVVIGAAMGVKYAYDQGWLGNMPPQFKLGMLYAAALAIIGVGEWVYRKVDPRAAVGIYAAGIASLFVVGYAGSAYFHLYEQVTAFGLMAGACAIGAAIALRGKLASIAVLSHIGANIAPMILHDRGVGEVPLLAYLLALQLMAVGLAHVGQGGRWWVLRTLALFTTSAWLGVRLVDPTTAHSLPTILFAAVYTVVFQLELVLAARRADAIVDPMTHRGAGSFSASTFSLAVTSAFTIELLGWTYEIYAPTPRGAFFVGLAMLTATAGAATLKTTGAVMRSLATSWLTQAALLLVIAIPVMLNGPSVTVAWAGLAAAYAVLGYFVRRPRTIGAGAGVWTLAAMQLLLATATDRPGDPLHGTIFVIHDFNVPAYLAIAVVLGIAGHVIALIAGSHRSQAAAAGSNLRAADGSSTMRGLSHVMAILAAAAWVIAPQAALPALAATVGLLVVGWTLAAIGHLFDHAIYAALGLGVVTLALAKWTAVDMLGERFGFNGVGATVDRHLFLNLPIAIGAACAASLLAMLWMARATQSADESVRGKWVAFSWIAVAMCVAAMTVGLSVEVERAASIASANGSLKWPAMQATMFGWTVLWLAAVQLLPVVGRTIDGSPARLHIAGLWAGVATILIAVKFIAIDAIGFAIDAPRVPVTPGLNLETLTAILVLAGLIGSFRFDGLRSPFATALRSAIFAVPLVIGSIELDRVFGPERTLIAWSAFWGVYAIASIAIGFARTSAAMRFAGLGLLGITLLKIVFVDLASASTGWRILSFLAVGIVLLATSVLYGKLSPKLLGSGSGEGHPEA